MTMTVTIKMKGDPHSETYSGIERISESGGQISLYDPADNLLAVAAKDKIESLTTAEESTDEQ